MSFFKKFFSKEKEKSLDKGLSKTKSSIFTKIGKAVMGKSKVDDQVLDDLEEILVTSDVGVNTTLKIIRQIEARAARDKYMNAAELDLILKEEIAELLCAGNQEDNDLEDFSLRHDKKPYILLVVGVNGVGKTTTIGKLASQYKAAGNNVLLAAADTFRAAAVEQLIMWGTRVGVPVISKGMHADPASVAYEATEKAQAENADILLIDTAGRLHTKVNLMNELSKIRRVIGKVIPDAPHEVMLVLDGSTGQNAVIQARAFTKATQVDSLTITKLDGTAKGGVVIGISDEFKIPVKYIGVGEKIEDLQIFNRKAFVETLFANQSKI